MGVEREGGLEGGREGEGDGGRGGGLEGGKEGGREREKEGGREGFSGKPKIPIPAELAQDLTSSSLCHTIVSSTPAL